MKRLRSVLCRLTVLCAVLSWAPQTRAYSAYYSGGAGTNLACTTCHSASITTCNGCHSHGTHPDSSKSSIDVTASTDKATYQPGETVTVTVNGGYRSGWVRANLYDGSMNPLASSCPAGKDACYASTFPATVSATAPTTPGTYAWRASWYGNAYDASGAHFSPTCGTPAIPPCFRVDSSNNAAGAVHGEEIVAVTRFTVAAATAGPAIAVTPTALAFGDVVTGAAATLAAEVRNTGTQALVVSAIDRCAGTSAEFTWSKSVPFTIDPGASVPVDVTYAPGGLGADSGCIALTSNDPAAAVADLAVSGAGVAGTSSGTQPHASSGGCGSTGPGGWLALAALALLVARRQGLRQRPAR